MMHSTSSEPAVRSVNRDGHRACGDRTRVLFADGNRSGPLDLYRASLHWFPAHRAYHLKD